MKVIFIEDVPNVAKIGQKKVVADGYARNYLIPRRLAVLADSPDAAAIEAQLRKKMKQRALEEAEMTNLAAKINGLQITLKAKVGEKDRLYGSVTSADIAAELTKLAGSEIDKKKIELAEPIRQTGTYDVPVKFTHEIKATVKVAVMSDEVTEVAAPPTESKEAKPAEPEAKAEGKKSPQKAKTTTEAVAPETPKAVGEEEAKATKKPRTKRAKKEKAAAEAEETPKQET